METVGLLFFVAFVVLAWMKNACARELATQVCARAGRSYDVQMLDGTVELSSMQLSFVYGGIRLRRRYSFSFSRDGWSRENGLITMVGHEVEMVYFTADDGDVILRP